MRSWSLLVVLSLLGCLGACLAAGCGSGDDDDGAKDAGGGAAPSGW